MKIKFLLIATLFFSFSAKPQNSVMNFDGVDDYIDLGNSVGNGVRTIEMWFKPSTAIGPSLNNIRYLVVRETSSSNLNEFNILFVPSAAANSGSIQWVVLDANGNSFKVYSDATSWNANQWYHLAAVIDPVQGMMLFIDGVKQASTNNSTIATTLNNSATTIGGSPFVANRYFSGSIDDVRFSSIAEYTSNFTPICPNLSLTSSTLGLWNFNDISNPSIAADSSSNNNFGIINGVVRIQDTVCAPVTFTNVLEFDGANDYVDLGNSVGNGVRTIELWFKPNTNLNANTSNHEYLVSRKINQFNNDEFNVSFVPATSIDAPPGTIQFVNWNSSGTSFKIHSDATSWNANQWYHLAAIVDPVQGMMLFIDGVKQQSTNTSTLPTTLDNNATTVGGSPLVSNRFFNGSIDDLRFSTTAEYTTNFTPPCTDLKTSTSTIGLWNFNDSSNVIIAADSSGNNNFGIITGAVGGREEVCKPVIESNVLSFDGVDDYIDLGNSVGNGVRSIEMWFKPSTAIGPGLNNIRYLVVRETSSSNLNEFNILFVPSAAANSGSIQWVVFDANGNSFKVYSDATSWNANQWYHLAAVIDPVQGMMLFIDGVKQNSTNSSTIATTLNNNATTIGGNPFISGRFFNGSIDDLRFSATAEYTSNFTPPCSDLKSSSSTIGLWNFNDSSNVIIAADSSGNNNFGIITGAVGTIEEACDESLQPNVLSFDGVDDYANLGDSVANNARTIEFWFQPETTINSNIAAGPYLILREIGTVNNNEFNIAFLPNLFQNAGAIQFAVTDNNNLVSRVFSDTTTWNADQWYHLAAVIDNVNGMMLFIDGQKQSSTNNSTAAISSVRQITTLAGSSVFPNQCFNGKIEDLRFSQAAEYSSNFTPPCTDLKASASTVGLWNFNDPSNNSIAIDSSGNSNSIQLIGAGRDFDSTICQSGVITSIFENPSLEEEIGFSLFPNPAKESISINFNGKESLRSAVGSIYRADGSLIKRFIVSSNLQIVDISSHPSGVYLFTANVNGQVHSLKYIKR